MEDGHTATRSEDTGGTADGGITAVQCPRHPGVESYLRCGKCDQPICPKCAVMTPVGSRCPDCARLRRLPVFELGARHYALAAIAGLLSALTCALVGAYVQRLLPFAWIIVPIAVGYVVGEAISRSVNRKRGRPLKVIAGVAVVLAMILEPVAVVVMHLPSQLLEPSVISSLLVTALGAFLVQPLALLAAAIGIYVATTRL